MPAVAGISSEAWGQAIKSLCAQGLLIPAQAAPVRIAAEDVRMMRQYLDKDTPQHAILKPLWAHIQPFTRCNQHCIHCYCHGGPTADPFLLPVDTQCRGL
jgi:hypothetical protein